MPENMELIVGTRGDDVIVRERTDLAAIIKGRDGLDIITSGARADRIYGGDGDDLIYGGMGNDELFGGRGSDVLSGGEQEDVIWATGNRAGDVDTVAPGSGNDMIYGSGKGRVVVFFDIRFDQFVFAGRQGRLGIDVIRTEVEQDKFGMWEVTRAIVQHGDQRIDFQFTEGPMQRAEPDYFDLHSTHHNTLLGGAWWV
jgi:Ca2+-binding RTX toxin-like protein